jgi:hypothetical protein
MASETMNSGVKTKPTAPDIVPNAPAAACAPSAATATSPCRTARALLSSLDSLDGWDPSCSGLRRLVSDSLLGARSAAHGDAKPSAPTTSGIVEKTIVDQQATAPNLTRICMCVCVDVERSEGMIVEGGEQRRTAFPPRYMSSAFGNSLVVLRISSIHFRSTQRPFHDPRKYRCT